jgi:hypothetical protein
MKTRLPAAWYILVVLLILGGVAQASLGDRLPDFKECVQVWETLEQNSCSVANMHPGLQRSQLRR